MIQGKLGFKTRAKEVGLNIGGILTAITPLSIYVGFNIKKFISTQEQTISFTVGAIMSLIFVFIVVFTKVKDMLPISKTLTTLAVIFIICFVLEPILSQATYISGMLLVGEIANSLTFIRFIKKFNLKYQAVALQSAAEEGEERLKKESKKKDGEQNKKSKLEEIKKIFKNLGGV